MAETSLRCFNETRTGAMRLSTEAMVLFREENFHAVIHRLLRLLWHNSLGGGLWLVEVEWWVKPALPQ